MKMISKTLAVIASIILVTACGDSPAHDKNAAELKGNLNESITAMLFSDVKPEVQCSPNGKSYPLLGVLGGAHAYRSAASSLAVQCASVLASAKSDYLSRCGKNILQRKTLCESKGGKFSIVKSCSVAAKSIYGKYCVYKGRHITP